MFARDNIVGRRLLAHPPERSLQVGPIVMKADRAWVGGELHPSIQQPLSKLIILAAIFLEAGVEGANLDQHIAPHGNIACAEVAIAELMTRLGLGIIEIFPPVAQSDAVEGWVR